MNAWVQGHRQAAGDAVRRLQGGIGAASLTVLALAVVLLLPAMGYWVVGHLERVGQGIAGPSEVSLWLADKTSAADREEIEKRLRGEAVARWRYVSREDALASLQSVSGLAEVAAGLKDNPLPDAYLVEPAQNDAAGIAAFAETAAGWPKVAEVHADVDWARRISTLVEVIRKILGLLSAILGVALVAVCFNTIRLQVAARQEEIDIALLIGATPAWAARPFLWLGVFEGLFAGLFATAVLYLLYALAAPTLAPLADWFGDLTAIGPPPLGLSGALVGGSTAIGWLGARLSVARIG